MLIQSLNMALNHAALAKFHDDHPGQYTKIAERANERGEDNVSRRVELTAC